MSRYRDRLFPALAGSLWVWFLALDILRLGDSTWVKFAGICLCGITALLGAHTVDGLLVAAALCLTVGADWFLLVREERYSLGVGLFILVQLLYSYRLYRLRGGKHSVAGLVLRIAALLFCLLQMRISVSVTCGAGIPVYWIASFFYFANLCVNTAEAFALGKARRKFAVGLLLFVCCDLCVGGWNLGAFPGFTRVGMWLFYLPSQVLIVLSQE